MLLRPTAASSRPIDQTQRLQNLCQFNRRLKIPRPLIVLMIKFTVHDKLFLCGDQEVINSQTRCHPSTSLHLPIQDRPAKHLNFLSLTINKMRTMKNAISLWITLITSNGMEMRQWTVARRWFLSFPFTTMTHTRNLHPPMPSNLIIRIIISIDIQVKSQAKYGHTRIHMLFLMHSTKQAPSELFYCFYAFVFLSKKTCF